MASSSSKRISLMLDSGAFSAWTRQQELVLEDYIEYVKARQHLVDGVVVLDTIPGVPGKKRTSSELELAADESYENLQRMKDAGIPAIPVFHQGERFEHLERYIKDGEPYIGISPSGDVIRFNQEWLDECFRLCTNDKGEPIVKTHGFGVSSPPILARYPWYSADSATWALKSGYGSLLFPKYPGDPKDGAKPDYTDPQAVSVWVTGQTRDTDRFDFQTFGELKQSCVRHFLEHEVGTNLTTMIYHPHERMRAMLVYYQKLQDQLVYTLHKFDGGINPIPKPFPNKKGLKWSHKKIITAVGSLSSPARAHMMCEAGITNRLASYWEIQDLPVADLERYVKDGYLAPWVPKKPNGGWGSVAYENYRALKLYDRVKSYEGRTDDEAR